MLIGSGAPQVSHYSSDSSEAGQGGTNEVAQQRLLGSPGYVVVVREIACKCTSSADVHL